MKNKKIYGKILVAFIILMLVLTYAASQIYTQNLPKVMLGEIKPGVIEHTQVMDATLHYQNVQEIVAPFDCTIKDVMIGADASLILNGNIAEVDMKTLLLKKYDLEIQLASYETQMNALDKDTPQYKRLAILKEELEAELASVDAAVEEGAYIVSEAEGTVLKVLVADGASVTAGTPILQYIPADTTQIAVTWTIPAGQAHFYPRDDVVISFSASVETSAGSESIVRNKMCTITSREENDSGGYDYEVLLDIAELENESIQYKEGTRVPIRLSSFEYEYPNVVPLSAVDKENGCVYVVREVKKEFGTEYRVFSASTRILMSNDAYAAITAISAEGDLIVYSDRQLYEGDIVKILE